MAGETQTLEPLTIVVPDAPPEVDNDAVVKAPEKAEKPKKAAEAAPDPAIANLQKQLDQRAAEAEEAKRRAAEAEKRAQTHQSEAATFRSQREQAEYESVTTALDSAKATMDRFEADLADAYERGDHKAVAKVNREMAALAPRITQLEDGKADMDAARKAPRTDAPPTPSAPADPFEAYVAKLTPAAAAWVRKHPDHVKDQRKYSKMIGAHHDALGEGIAPDSPEYFAHIEKRLGLSDDGQAPANDPPMVTQTPPQRERPTAAPVARGVGTNGGGGNGTRVTLTPEMRATARALDMSDEEYAANLQRARADGRYTN